MDFGETGPSPLATVFPTVDFGNGADPGTRDLVTRLRNYAKPLERHFFVAGTRFQESIVGVHAGLGPGPLSFDNLEAGRLGAQKEFHFALRVLLPLAARQPLPDFDLVPDVHVIHAVAAVVGEFDGNIVGEAPSALFDHHHPFAKALLPERLGGFDQVDYPAHLCITHCRFIPNSMNP